MVAFQLSLGSFGGTHVLCNEGVDIDNN